MAMRLYHGRSPQFKLSNIVTFCEICKEIYTSANTTIMFSWKNRSARPNTQTTCAHILL